MDDDNDEGDGAMPGGNFLAGYNNDNDGGWLCW